MTHTHREHHVKLKVEIRVMLVNAKDFQRLPANYQKLEKKHETVSSSQA